MRSKRTLAALVLANFLVVGQASGASADDWDFEYDSSDNIADFTLTGTYEEGATFGPTLNGDCDWGTQTVQWLVDWENADNPEQFLVGYKEELSAMPADTEIGYIWCVDIWWGRAWEATERPPESVLIRMVLEAFGRLEVPVQAGSSAPAGDADIPMITQLPSLLWVDDAVWQPRDASASLGSFMTVVVTATPANISFNNSAGDSVDCGANDGVIDLSQDLGSQPSDCALTWRQSSVLEDGWLESTLIWSVDYTCSGFCPSPEVPLPDLEVTITRPVLVGEIQALETE